VDRLASKNQFIPAISHAWLCCYSEAEWRSQGERHPARVWPLHEPRHWWDCRGDEDGGETRYRHGGASPLNELHSQIVANLKQLEIKSIKLRVQTVNYCVYLHVSFVLHVCFLCSNDLHSRTREKYHRSAMLIIMMKIHFYNFVIDKICHSDTFNSVCYTRH